MGTHSGRALTVECSAQIGELLVVSSAVWLQGLGWTPGVVPSSHIEEAFPCYIVPSQRKKKTVREAEPRLR